jgi:histidinol-phosphate/aromatic aminotransferase/cobyric acid decarboxylase-like protein
MHQSIFVSTILAAVSFPGVNRASSQNCAILIETSGYCQAKLFNAEASNELLPLIVEHCRAGDEILVEVPSVSVYRVLTNQVCGSVYERVANNTFRCTWRRVSRSS